MRFGVGLALIVGMAAMGCGGDGGFLKPQRAAGLFSSPDGSLNTENATEAFSQALQSTRAFENSQGVGVGGGALQSSGLQSKADFETCFSGSGTTGVLDVACIYSDDPDCTGSGEIGIRTSGDPNGDSFTVDLNYRNAQAMCIDATSFLCNGTGSYTFVDGVQYTCNDLSCSIDGGDTVPTQGCFTQNQSGMTLVLVELDNGSVVCLSIQANEDCTRACSEWQDVEGFLTINCDVTETTGAACTGDSSTILEVDNCTIDRENTSCSQTMDTF